MTVDRAVLERHWVHSHEEDTESELVFRPSSYAFPPSRGRSALALHPDGSYDEAVPGPTDRPVAAEGTWQLEGDELRLKAGDGTTRALRIVSADADRLVVGKER